tara:strand:+ start:10863 stop:11063 length:201 start_codon:yes stop_codon:yes gene_type:complete
MDLLNLDTILACPACRFNDSSVTQAANLAIGVMVMVVFGVLSAFIAFIVKLAKGERAVAAVETRQH